MTYEERKARQREYTRRYRSRYTWAEREARRNPVIRSAEREKSRIRLATAFREGRKEVLRRLGGKCVVCSWDDFRALHVDHIKSDGHLERKAFGRGINKYQRMLDNPDFENCYQLLCANHNSIKAYEANEIGHNYETEPFNSTIGYK